ncbi:hypothetical protein [Aliterella atlantica]
MSFLSIGEQFTSFSVRSLSTIAGKKLLRMRLKLCCCVVERSHAVGFDG